ncbi:MAG: hypothetical protein ACQESG_00335 [Nanobdellota archaeon]
MKRFKSAIASTLILALCGSAAAGKSQIPDTPKPTVVEMGELAGSRFANLFTDYTGIEGLVPEKATIDFTAQIRSTWHEKMKANDSDTIKNFYQNEVLQYDHTTTEKVSFQEYLDSIDQIIDNTYQHIDWEKVRRRKPIGFKKVDDVRKAIPLDDTRLDILKGMAGVITADHMTSYACTETMPSSHGEKNLAVFEFLVEKAGPEFIYNIASQGDNHFSFGPYQLTPPVVGESGKYDATGASIIGKALPEHLKPPTSLEEVTGEEHHRVAYLLAINNIADALRKVDDQHLQTLSDNWENHIGDLARYIAVANHHPKDAHKAFQYWAENDAQHDLRVSCSERLLPYIHKTSENLAALSGITTRPNPYIPSGTIPSSQFGGFEKVQDGTHTIFRYIVNSGDHPAEIIRKFDRDDNSSGDFYKDMTPRLFKEKTYMNLVNAPDSKEYVGEELQPGQIIYLRAKKN